MTLIDSDPAGEQDRSAIAAVASLPAAQSPPGLAVDVEAAPPRWRTMVRGLLLALLAATVVALLQSVNLVFRALDVPGSPPAPSWLHLFLLELPVWYSPVLLAPLIVAVCDRFPLWPAPRFTSVLGHLLLAPPIVLASIALMTLGRLPLDTTNPDGYWVTTGQYARSFSLVFLFNYVLVAAIYSAYARARRERQLTSALTRTRLEQLSAQLQPHFLFNALHGVSALMGEDVVAARSMLAHLARLLRSSFEHAGASEVPLAVELGWLHDYAIVQRYRHPRLSVQVEAPPESLQLLVPRFVLQPLVENSVRHGLESHGGALAVLVQVTLEGHELRIHVRDDGPGFVALPPRRGIGLRNVRQRLALLHEDAALYVRNHAGGGAEVEIVLPRRPPRALSRGAAAG